MSPLSIKGLAPSRTAIQGDGNVLRLSTRVVSQREMQYFSAEHFCPLGGLFDWGLTGLEDWNSHALRIRTSLNMVCAMLERQYLSAEDFIPCDDHVTGAFLG